MAHLTPPGPCTEGLRIGLMGGSFNPAHEGHRYVSLTAIKRLKLDYVWWLVSPGNPLKDPADMAPLDCRMAVARKVADHPAICVSDIERHTGSVYTIDTLRTLQMRFAHVEFVWLMGSDNLMQFHRWRNWRGIANEMPVVVVLRPGSVLAPLKAKAMGWFGAYRAGKIGPAPRLILLDGRRSPQSATAIRTSHNRKNT